MGNHMLLTALSAGVLCGTMCHASELRLDFEDGVDAWQIVVDGVMGGRSSGRVTETSGILAFTGDLSLENNGGFSQLRRPVSGDAFGGAEGIELKVRGDGRTYIFDLRASNARVMAGSYQQQFDTIDGTWITLRLPFEDFRLHSFGREISNAPTLSPDRIESIGVTLADKVEGDFLLEVDFIGTYADDRESMQEIPASTSQEILRLIELSINRGAPLFNDGQHAACASVYEMTIESILALASAEIDDAVVQRLRQGLADGARASTWTERAWAYRRAFDDVFSMLTRPATSANRTA